MIDPPSDAVRADADAYRRWIDAQSPAELAELALAGLLATDSFPNDLTFADSVPHPHSKRATVDALVRQHQESTSLTVPAGAPTVIFVLRGVDNVAAAMASLDGEPEWSLVGDVLTVDGVPEMTVRQALVDARR